MSAITMRRVLLWIVFVRFECREDGSPVYNIETLFELVTEGGEHSRVWLAIWACRGL